MMQMRKGRAVHVASRQRAIDTLLAAEWLPPSHLSKDRLRRGYTRGNCGRNKKAPTIHHEQLHKT
jgi:hypothetical protein